MHRDGAKEHLFMGYVPSLVLSIPPGLRRPSAQLKTLQAAYPGRVSGGG